MRLGLLALVIALAAIPAALAHGPNAVPDDPNLQRQYRDGIAAYQQDDYATAREKWLPLAEKGSSAAQLFVAFMYENGLGVAKDDSAAAAWYRDSAERGNMVAQVRLAIMYRDGRGVPEDRVKAWFWAGMAAREEDHMQKIGKALQRDLAEVMSPEELAAAGSMLREHAGQH